MDEERKIMFFLNRLSQPGFLVQDGRIFTVNQAAGALLLTPGLAFSPMLCSGSAEYAALEDGQLCAAVDIGGTVHPAIITRTEAGDLVLLESGSEFEEFRSMALVSMELRAPLMRAINAAQAQPVDARLNQSLMQILRIVSNMSDISRYAASSRMEIRDADSFLLELFEKAQQLAGPGVAIRFQGLRQPVFTLMDPEQLERAVWNLLSNCLKFLPENGSITGTLSRQGNILYLTIEDSGSGIAQQVRANLFQRYLRQPGIEDSRYGLGLGLAIVRTAAANHGGTLLVSNSKTGGTKVTLTLRIRQTEDSLLHSPLFRPDYTGGWDHGLVELADCLKPEQYARL